MVGILLLLSSSCAHQAVRDQSDSAELVSGACNTGMGLSSVQGSVWIKATSKEASGRFPAVVKVEDNGNLDMEVTNLVGGTQAKIRVDGMKYRITVPGKKSRTQKGYGSWGGIPLFFAKHLFLGKIPCPNEEQLAHSEKTVEEDGSLTLDVKTDVGSESYHYTFRNFAGSPWPEALVWELSGGKDGNVRVEFEFDKPEKKTRSPLKWKAVSDRGEVQTRWRDRKLKWGADSV